MAGGEAGWNARWHWYRYLSSRTGLAGNVVKQIAADGGEKRYVYDMFGDNVLATDELGFRTRNTYDRMARLTQVERDVVSGGLGSEEPTEVLTERYQYDFAGHRSEEINAAGHATFYDYHLDGTVRTRTSSLGFTTEYNYDPQGRKTYEKDANGLEQHWEYDQFGRLLNHVDIGGVRTEYTYDLAGQLVKQTSTLGQHQAFFYDEAGHLTRIVDTGTPVRKGFASVVGVNRISEYGYDVQGRRVAERTVLDGRVHQDSFITFDALGRMARVNDPDYEVSYSYDGVGNRTRIDADYFNHIGKGPGFVQNQDLWYTYDTMNRVLKSQGMNFAGVIQITASQGVDLTYNLRGERVSATTHGEHLSLTQEKIGTTVISQTYNRVFSGEFTERYGYDAVGRLVSIKQDTPTASHDQITGNWTQSITEVATTTRTWDAASREILSITYALDPEENSASTRDRTETSSTYDVDGRLQQQITKLNSIMTARVTYGDAQFHVAQIATVTSPVLRSYNTVRAVRSGVSGRATAAVPRGGVRGGATQMTTTQRFMPNHWTGTGWDAVGNLRGYKIEFFKDTNGKFLYSTEHKFDYRFGPGYQLIGETAFSFGKNAPGKGLTTRTYDVNGALVQLTDTEKKSNNRYFANDAMGQALTVVNGNFDGHDGHLTAARAFDNALTRTGNKVKAQYFFFANGQNIGTFGQLAGENNAIEANFDVNFTPVSPHYPASAPSQVVVQEGDTLRSIAARVFGDASLWYILAEANGLTNPDEKLAAGTQLDIPNKIVSLQNSADSFKPFDPGQAIGDATPTQPPPKGGCGIAGMILMIVITIVVVYFVGPRL